MNDSPEIKAEVIAVFPDKVKISVDDIASFSDGKSIKVGSYLRITDNEDCALIAIIENFCIEVTDKAERRHIIEALPLGIIRDGKFLRGGDTLTIPPTGVSPATEEDIRRIFSDSVAPERKFEFCSLVSNDKIPVPVDGNRFFNKHIAVVGSTGAGKSHTITKIIQNAVAAKDGEYSLNNSHVVIFDIHSEYRTAFPDANFLDVTNLKLPYWLLNSEELEEILLDTGERDNYNQSSVFRHLVTENKRKHNPSLASVFYDSPLKFDIHEVLNALYNMKNETVNAKNETRYMVIDPSYSLLAEGKTDASHGLLLTAEERLERYFASRLEFHTTKSQSITNGSYADKSLDKFFSRFESKVGQDGRDLLILHDAQRTHELEANAASAHHAHDSRGTEVVFPAIDRDVRHLRQHLRDNPVQENLDRRGASGTSCLNGRFVGMLDGFGKELADHAYRVQAQSQYARQRAKANRSNENDAQDQFGNRAQRIQGGSGHLIDHRMRRGVAGREEGQGNR